MKFKTRVFLLLLVGICLLQFNTSCVKIWAEKTITVSKGAIPPEFGKDSTVLLLIKNKPNRYNKHLVKIFSEYLWKFELVDYKDLYSSKYSNKRIYRYYFNYEYICPNPGELIYVKLFFIQDRIEGKRYDAHCHSSYTGRILKAYVNNLNTVIKLYHPELIVPEQQ